MKDKVVLITDCDTEFGITIIETLVNEGMMIIAFGKDDEIICKTSKTLLNSLENHKDKFLLLQCDITDIQQLEENFNNIKDKYKGIDVLINNASCDIDCQVSSGDFEDFNKIINTNINGLVACINLASKSMLDRNIKGHIVNMNDVKAYEISDEANKSIYLATKASVTSINEILKYEFRNLNANIKVTNVACGGFGKDDVEDPSYKIKYLVSVVIDILNTPEHLHILEILIEWEAENSRH